MNLLKTLHFEVRNVSILLVITIHKNDDLKTGLLKSLMNLSGIEEKE